MFTCFKGSEQVLCWQTVAASAAASPAVAAPGSSTLIVCTPLTMELLRMETGLEEFQVMLNLPS